MACKPHGWQRSVFRTIGGSIVLLILAVLLARPTLQLFAAPAVQQGPPALRQRVQQVMARAQRDQRPYTILLLTNSSRITVLRWTIAPGTQSAHPETIPELCTPLPDGITVASTTLDEGELVINERGSLLSMGKVVLSAPDGSRVTVVVDSATY